MMQEATFNQDKPEQPQSSLIDTDDLVFALGSAAVEKIAMRKQIDNLKAAAAKALAAGAESGHLRDKAETENKELRERNASLAQKNEWQDQQRLKLEKDLADLRLIAQDLMRKNAELRTELDNRRKHRSKKPITTAATTG